MPLPSPLLLLLQQQPKPVRVGRYHYQGYRADKAFLAMGPYHRQAPLVQIVRRRLYGRMLATCIYEVRRPLPLPILLGATTLLRHHVQVQ